MHSNQEANLLINESSPYLLQHAYNPVKWRPWNEESLAEAKKQDKPLLISIGYSACHWCHVMERESFEDSAIAAVMNDYFICIKVDREERPDIDHLYMDAVQLMSGKGGWPLNCFALPDGRPFYGGTYFPKEQWKSILLQLSEVYKNDRSKVEEYAEKLSEGLRKNELIELKETPAAFNASILDSAIEKWKSTFDPIQGGSNYAPKFPMPNNYEFLLHYLYFHQDEEIKKHLKLTLKKMAYGGIYDQIGGGFARYSTDMEWKVPHFEKMLYDNAQLIGLYSKAYKHFKDPLYKQVVEECIEFINRELRDESGAYYSALDADSEGEEGKFYTWSKNELKDILNEKEYEAISAYYNLNEKGEWEGRYIPLRINEDSQIAEELNLDLTQLNSLIESARQKMFKHRESRVRPGLDDKSLTSWNALSLIALLEAYEAIESEEYLESAIEVAQFIKKHQINSDDQLLHSYKNGVASINGFLEDYSFTIESFIKLYENTFDLQWLNLSDQLAKSCLQNYYDSSSSYFYFNSKKDPQLVSRKIEKNDNVIPASNSSLCKALFKLGHLLNKNEYLEISDQMLANSSDLMMNYLPYSSNWAQQLFVRSKSFQEVAIVGEKAIELKKKMSSHYLPNSIFMGQTEDKNSLELLEHKYVEGTSLIYVCENKSCKKPVEEASEAIDQIKNQ